MMMRSFCYSENAAVKIPAPDVAWTAIEPWGRWYFEGMALLWLLFRLLWKRIGDGRRMFHTKNVCRTKMMSAAVDAARASEDDSSAGGTKRWRNKFCYGPFVVDGFFGVDVGRGSDSTDAQRGKVTSNVTRLIDSEEWDVAWDALCMPISSQDWIGTYRRDSLRIFHS